MEEKQVPTKGKPNCFICGVVKTIENANTNKGKRWSAYCKKCEMAKVKAYKQQEATNMGRRKTKKEWVKSNKNHYPDPDWVWRQIELNEGAAQFMERLDQKYALSKHGNSGKTNRWKNENGTRMNSEQMKKHNK